MPREISPVMLEAAEALEAWALQYGPRLAPGATYGMLASSACMLAANDGRMTRESFMKNVGDFWDEWQSKRDAKGRA